MVKVTSIVSVSPGFRFTTSTHRRSRNELLSTSLVANLMIRYMNVDFWNRMAKQRVLKGRRQEAVSDGYCARMSHKEFSHFIDWF